MKKTRGERLRRARIDAGFPSARKAAEALGLPVSTYNAHERAELPGGRDYSLDEAERYARRFRVSSIWLFAGRGAHATDADDIDPDKPAVPVRGYVGAGAEAHFYAVAQGDLDEVPSPPWATPNTVAVEIRGDSLGPTYNRWLVFYDDVRSPVTPDLIGHLCVVGLPDDRVLIKRLHRGKAGTFDLISDFDEPIRGVAVDWAARVKSMAPKS